MSHSWGHRSTPRGDNSGLGCLTTQLHQKKSFYDFTAAIFLWPSCILPPLVGYSVFFNYICVSQKISGWMGRTRITEPSSISILKARAEFKAMLGFIWGCSGSAVCTAGPPHLAAVEQPLKRDKPTQTKPNAPLQAGRINPGLSPWSSRSRVIPAQPRSAPGPDGLINETLKRRNDTSHHPLTVLISKPLRHRQRESALGAE